MNVTRKVNHGWLFARKSARMPYRIRFRIEPGWNLGVRGTAQDVHVEDRMSFSQDDYFTDNTLLMTLRGKLCFPLAFFALPRLPEIKIHLCHCFYYTIFARPAFT